MSVCYTSQSQTLKMPLGLQSFSNSEELVECVSGLLYWVSSCMSHMLYHNYTHPILF